MRLLDIEGKQHDLLPRDLHELTYERSTETTHVALRDQTQFDVFMKPTHLLQLLTDVLDH